MESQRRDDSGAPPGERSVPVVLSTQINERRRIACDSSCPPGHQRLPMIALGTAGTGTSYLVKALSYLLGDHVRPAAPTGMAVFWIGGYILHSPIKLSIRTERPFNGDSLKTLQTTLEGIEYLVLDDLSMVKQVQFA